jgi:hypothetical protein
VARPRGKLKSGVASDGPEPSPKLKRGRTMEQHSEIFIGLDPSKLKISVAVANGERKGEVRFYGDIPSDPGSVRSMVDKLATRGARLHFCYEAGPTGYDLHRQIIAMGHDCVVVAPSLIPKRPGDRVKTNRRDAVSLARLHRADSPPCGFRTQGMKRYATWFGPGRRPATRSSGAANSCKRFCCATVGSIAV